MKLMNKNVTFDYNSNNFKLLQESEKIHIMKLMNDYEHELSAK
jgi:hypothetical protein